MKIAICDDERVELELISEYCNEWSKSKKDVCIIDIFRSAEEKYRSKRQTPIHNSEMDVIRGYLKTKGIFLREEKLPDEVEIGFENVD